MHLGVIGAGVMGANHARAIAALGHDLVGVADIDTEAAQTVAKRHGAPGFADLDALLAFDDPPQAVVVATPTVTHPEIAGAALDAGLHVLVEKPLAPETRSAVELVDKAAAAGLVLAVGHIERHNPVVAYAKRALEAQRFGRPITFAARRVSRYPGRIRDVGCILDIGIHDIDVLNHLAGAPPETVYALGGTFTEGLGLEDHANLLVEYPGGLSGAVEVNWLTPRKVRRLSLTCAEAFVECDYIDQSVEVSRTTYGEFDPADLSNIPLDMHRETVALQREEPLQRELRDFVTAIEEGRPPLADGTAGVQAIAVAEAALASLKSRRPESPALEAIA